MWLVMARRSRGLYTTNSLVPKWLSLAVVGFLHVPAAVAEPVIAASVVFVGIENLLRGQMDSRWKLTFAFGLVHGFGFAWALRELGVGARSVGVTAPLGWFNAGVEMGQIGVVILLWPIIHHLNAGRPPCARGLRLLDGAMDPTGTLPTWLRGPPTIQMWRALIPRVWSRAGVAVPDASAQATKTQLARSRSTSPMRRSPRTRARRVRLPGIRLAEDQQVAHRAEVRDRARHRLFTASRSSALTRCRQEGVRSFVRSRP